jgi:hypothetical protein
MVLGLKLIEGLLQLGVVSSLDDVVGGGCLLLDEGLLEDPLGLPTERFEDRDGFPALAGQQIYGRTCCLLDGGCWCRG